MNNDVPKEMNRGSNSVEAESFEPKGHFSVKIIVICTY